MNQSMLYHSGFDNGPVQLGRYLSRLTAPNPGPLTGSGTNTYLIGRLDKYLIVDPGPNIDSHIESILKAVGGACNIAGILLTHMHADHSPAGKALAELSGAPVYGCSPKDDDYQDKSIALTRELEHDEVVSFDGLNVRAIHTPGHVDNHFCFLLEEDGILMTGDHIMQGSTVVIIPPHGNMKRYLNSLSVLLDYSIKALAPGHGELMPQPQDEIQRIIDHRMMREGKVVRCLEQIAAPVALELLTQHVYDDVDESLHPVAQLSLMAHLIKLEEEERAHTHEGRWRLRG